MTDYKTPLYRTFTASINNQPSLSQRSALVRASLHPLMDRRLYSTIKEYVSEDFNYDFFLEKKLPMKALKWAMEKGQNYSVMNIVNSPTYKPLIDWNILAGYCIKYDYPELYSKILENNKITDWTCIMAQAARLRIWKLIHKYEEKKYHLNTVLMYAGESGEQKMIDHFLNKIENPTKENYARIVVGAARGGHKYIIDEYRNFVSGHTIKIAAEQAIIHKHYNLGTSLYVFSRINLSRLVGESGDCNYISKYYDTESENINTNLVLGVAKSDNVELLLSLLKRVFFVNILYNHLLSAHISAGNTYFIDFFIEEGANDWNSALEASVETNNRKLMEFFIEKGADGWNRGLLKAVETENKELMEFFMEKGADDWDGALLKAVETENKELIDFFIEKGADGWNEALLKAIEAENKDLIDFFIDKGADNLNSALLKAVEIENKELINFFREKGAREINTWDRDDQNYANSYAQNYAQNYSQNYEQDYANSYAQNYAKTPDYKK